MLSLEELGDWDAYPESLEISDVALPALNRELEPRSSDGMFKGCKAPDINGYKQQS